MGPRCVESSSEFLGHAVRRANGPNKIVTETYKCKFTWLKDMDGKNRERDKIRKLRIKDTRVFKVLSAQILNPNFLQRLKNSIFGSNFGKRF